MKRLEITYDGKVLFDGEVAELSWKDSEGEVTVTGRQRRQPAGSGTAALSGLGDLFTKARKAQTEKIVAEKRQEITAEVESEVAS